MTIVSVESKIRRKQWKILLTLSNGEILELDPDAFASFNLHSGDMLDESTKESLLLADQQKRGLQQALRWLAVRPQAGGELRRRLNQKGFAQVADNIIEKLRSQDYINDDDFARRYVKTRLLTKNIGRRMIEAELKAKGIAGVSIERVLDELMDLETTLRLAKKAVSKKMALLKKLDPAKRKRKIYSFLLQRGFDSEIIAQVLKEEGL